VSNNVVLNQVIILFLIMLVGAYASKRNIITEDVNKKLSEFLLNITVPLLVISSFQLDFSKDMLNNAAIVFIIAVGIHAASALLAKLLYHRYPDSVKTVLKFITTFSNCGFMGFPVLESIYGKTGVFYGSIYVISYNLFLWTYGVMLFSGERDLKTMKKALLNPGITSVAVGLLLFVFSIKLPYPILKTVETVGSMTTPISMIIVGALLAELDFKRIFSGFHIYYGTFVRLVLIPAIVYTVLKTVGFTGTLFGVCVVSVAMPAAANTAIFAQKYDGDALLASQCIGISTVISVITIPLFLLFL